MALKLMGKKRGMTQIFDEQGNLVVCTVIEVEPNVIVQVKTKQSDGYDAVQIGFDEVKTKDPRTVEGRVSKPMRGHFAKGNLSPRRYLREARLQELGDYDVGQEIGVDIFEEGAFLDVSGTSKGKGYQGVMKLHGFRGGPAAHGSGFHRHAGSTGMRSTPGRCLPGGKRASQMGNRKQTTQSLQVVKVSKDDGTILLKGAVPGAIGGLVVLSEAVKKQTKK